ncbi:MAG: SDR family oxidoreductase [Spirochaetia bacterium]|nr:SDR family oxidoreductase [Spirochaetia bacterium]
MKKILVTGGAGFLGSHLCEKLLNRGDKVYCLDNLYTGSLNNLESFKSNANLEFINHDIINPVDLKVDEIYNLACPASPVHYQAKAIETWKTSVFGIYNMLELARKNDARILQASTSEVYGDPEVNPQKEEYRGNVNPIGPRACYDEGKRAAESLCFDYFRKYNTKIKVIRIFNTYGPRMNKEDGRVVSNFIVQALTGADITIYGDGTQTRSFCYVADLINGIVAMMDSDVNFQGPVNLGNPFEFTMLELAKKVVVKVGSSSKIIFRDLPVDDPLQRKPLIDLAKKKLKWESRIQLEEGLEYTITYFRSLLDVNR